MLGRTTIMQLLLLSLLYTLVNCSEDNTVVEENECEMLKSRLTYSQENAPRDISAVLRIVVEKLNRELDSVVDVEVNWTGSDVNLGGPSAVGHHSVESTVTFLDPRDNSTKKQCYIAPFEITDIDECSLPLGHPMRHSCSASSECVNTVGSYECKCNRIPPDSSTSMWNVSLSTSSCPYSASTEGCCAPDGQKDGGCRANFVCPVDPCGGAQRNNCDSMAICERGNAPPTYSCVCPEGLMGNGHICQEGEPIPRPELKYDGKTPTDETLKANYCSCTKPTIDPCSGIICEKKNEVCQVAGTEAKCVCKPGYLWHKEFGCVDTSLPVLKLRCDPDNDGITKLVQGGKYEECAVDVLDDNAEDYLRTLKITYSQPMLHGCLRKMGDFYVKYSIATPWTEPPFVTITRTVRVDDLNECEITTKQAKFYCPEVLPKCDTDAGAICVNTIGSYTCKCPKYTSGDGFLPIEGLKQDAKGRYVDAPTGYAGGKGCVDTSKPVIELLGPNPKIFRTCRCSGLYGAHPSSIVTKKRKPEGSMTRINDYEEDLVEMIKSSEGTELCATSYNAKSLKPNSCAYAVDHTYSSIVDLSSRVVIGEPVRVPGKQYEWKVPYNVADDAGNRADTQWRTIVVEEVSLQQFESQIRNEEKAKRQQEIDDAIAAAVQLERANTTERSQRGKGKDKICPTCPECKCPKSSTDCSKICSEHGQMACEANFLGSIGRDRSWSTLDVPRSLLALCFCLILVALLLFNMKSKKTRQEQYSTFAQTPIQQPQQSHRTEQKQDNAPSIFSPSHSRKDNNASSHVDDDIYASRDIITPIRSNGVTPIRNQWGNGSYS